MPNKIENVIVLTALGLALFLMITASLGVRLASPFLSADVVGGCMLFICFYAMYWSLEIRRRLSSKIFRNQALGVALISLVLSVFVFLVFMDGLDINPALNVNLGQGIIGSVLPSATIFAIVYWIDASIRATQRTDPLSRDPLKWNYVRWVLWGLVLAFTIFGTILSFIIPNPNVSALLYNAATLPLLLAVPSGIVYISISLTKSGDKHARYHFGWFVLFLASIFVGWGIINPVSVGGGLAIGVLFGSYCLYRSARALGRLQHRIVSVSQF
jgi:hypothetical protein